MESMLMSLEESRRTQRPYRYGMILLCIGALINWVGLADSYPEPIRYIGVASILAGALLICAAMCCWLHTPQRTGTTNEETNDPIHIISAAEQSRREKPPDYETVEIPPPTYDDAIKLSPTALLTIVNERPTSSTNDQQQPDVLNTNNRGIYDIGNDYSNSNNNNFSHHNQHRHHHTTTINSFGAITNTVRSSLTSANEKCTSEKDQIGSQKR